MTAGEMPMSPVGASDDEWCEGRAEDVEGACTHCGGDAYVECDDPIQCCARHVSGFCPCVACNGTGEAKHQWIW